MINLNRYKKKDDAYFLAEIREVLRLRPTYGYKRITAMINRKRKKQGLKKINKKRIYRVMDMNGLILKRLENLPKKQKTGKIVTLHSNTRWCSDAYEIHCFNGEKVYVAFCLDTHDRECIAHVASKEPLLAKDIQNLMLKSIHGRFDSFGAPKPIQFLSDRGSIYRAKETIRLGKSIGLDSCYTRAYSPQSNGMSEAFVNTSKRDYVYTHDCYDADTVMEMIPQWYQDYNENAPHSGPRMKSPLEYRKPINSGV